MKTFDMMLSDYLDPVGRMKRRYPKAAKKRRVVKKWKARFGTHFEDSLRGESFMLTFLDESSNSWLGGTLSLPLTVGGSHAYFGRVFTAERV